MNKNTIKWPFHVFFFHLRVNIYLSLQFFPFSDFAEKQTIVLLLIRLHLGNFCFIFPAQTRPLNVASIHQGNKLEGICHLLSSFGLIGDMMRACEKYRWMGNVRYKSKFLAWNRSWSVRRKVCCVWERLRAICFVVWRVKTAGFIVWRVKAAGFIVWRVKIH